MTTNEGTRAVIELGADLERGLTTTEVAARRAQVGANELPEKPGRAGRAREAGAR